MKPQDMPAGRDMDRMVAEQILGWKRGIVYGNRNGEWIVPGHKGYPITFDCTPKFSEKIDAAWKLIEHAAKQGLHVRISIRLDIAGEANGYIVKWNGYYHIAETAPLAICQAALLAKEKQR